MSKVSPAVGPKHPQLVVLLGATGDLAQRKLLPGLFHLVSRGFIPSCRIVGVSLDLLDADGFRNWRGAPLSSLRRVRFVTPHGPPLPDI